MLRCSHDRMIDTTVVSKMLCFKSSIVVMFQNEISLTGRNEVMNTLVFFVARNTPKIK